MIKRARSLVLVAALAATALAVTDPQHGQTFTNPLLSAGQDPSVVRDGGFYHLVQSDRDGISVRTSLTLTGLGNAPRTVVWQGDRDGSPCCELWAPELVKLGNRWYIYYAADDGRNENHHMYVLEASAPRGPYSFKGKIADASDRWAIDGTVLENEGRRYLVWSGWEGTQNVQQNLYIAPMSDPWTISGERALISEPDQPWEQIGQPLINEGPEVLRRGGKTHLIYSASGSWTDDYCLGRLTLTGNDPMKRESWVKSSGCVFSRNDKESVYAPGHNIFTTSPDGREDWQLYHAISYPGASWGGRSIRAQRFTWTADGTPDFGRPAAFETRLPLPSGEYEAEGATLEKAAARTADFASGGRAVSLGSGGAVEFRHVRAQEAGSYTVRVHFSNGAAASSTSLSVNGAPPATVSYPRTVSRQSFGTVALTVSLRAGDNTLRFNGGLAQTTDLDAITVSPAGR